MCECDILSMICTIALNMCVMLGITYKVIEHDIGENIDLRYMEERVNLQWRTVT